MKRSAILWILVLLLSTLQTAIPAVAAPQVVTIQVRGMVCDS